MSFCSGKIIFNLIFKQPNTQKSANRWQAGRSFFRLVQNVLGEKSATEPQKPSVLSSFAVSQTELPGIIISIRFMPENIYVLVTREQCSLSFITT